MEIGWAKYMTLDIKVNEASILNYLKLNIISRLPQGDVFNNASVMISGSTSYGALELGKWVTIKVPLSVLGIGKGTCVGGISGDVLTVASVEGLFAQASNWISGGGLPAPIAINSAGNSSNGAGSYVLGGTANIPAGTTFNAQRTNYYKFSLVDQNNSSGIAYFLDNVGFTTN
jgi:hypothetical protein